VARFTPALSGCAAVPNGVLVAAVAGKRFGADSGWKASHRAILRHAVLVRDGRCSGMICVGAFRVHQRALRGFGTSECGRVYNIFFTRRQSGEYRLYVGNFGLCVSKNEVVFVLINVR